MAATQYADFGITVVETDIDRAVIATLMTWLPTYLSQAERVRALANHTIARPQDGSYQNVLTDDTFPEGRLPAVIVTTAKTDGEPPPRVDGYGAIWRTDVFVVVRGRTATETREVAAVFGGCVRSLLCHQQILPNGMTSLDGEVKWRGSEILPVPDESDQGRWLASAMNTFLIYVDEVLTGDGPTSPDDPDPIYDPPTDPDAPFDPLVTVAPGGATTTVIPKPRS